MFGYILRSHENDGFSTKSQRMYVQSYHRENNVDIGSFITI